MKKRKTIIIIFSILFLSIGTISLAYSFFKEKKYQENNSPDNSKKLLELNHSVAQENFEIESQQKKLNELKVAIKETSLQRYNNQLELKNIVEIINSNFNISLDDHWKYYIHFYNEENTNGLISFVYWIGEEIETTKTILLPIENNIVNTIFYSNLDKTVDEEKLIERLKNFQKTTVQEKYEYSENETFVEEKTEYIYNYQNNLFKYAYYLFFKDAMHEINNDVGNAYLID